MSNGSLSVDEKTAILIKSYELEPLPKLALEIGETATRDILHSGQYLGHLVRKRNMHWIGYEKDVQLLDTETAKVIRDDPVYGFSHYIVDHGVANVFGKQIFEGKMPLEPAIGAASAIGIVERDRQSGKTSVFTKKQLGIESTTIRDIAKKFHSGKIEETRMSEMRDIENKEKPIKENYEVAREQILKRKAEEEKKLLKEEDIKPDWMKSDSDILVLQERKIEITPPLKEDGEQGIPLWNKKEVIDVDDYEINGRENEDEEYEDEDDYYEEDGEELPFEEPEETEYLLPFDVKKKDDEDEEDDVRLPF
jgi:hypothetical protein